MPNEIKKVEAPARKPEAAVFEAAEIAANAPRLFGFSVDLATAALAQKGMKAATLDDARAGSKAFAERKVH